MGLIYFISFWGFLAICLGVWLAVHVRNENKTAALK